MKKGNWIGPVLLFLAALIWGASFVAQDVGGVVGSFTFQAIRNFLGALTLLLVCTCACAQERRPPLATTREKSTHSKDDTEQSKTQ